MLLSFVITAVLQCLCLTVEGSEAQRLLCQQVTEADVYQTVLRIARPYTAVTENVPELFVK